MESDLRTKALNRETLIEKCPLCFARVGRVIEHLRSDHRRTMVEARELLQRSLEGTLGWDPVAKKEKLVNL